MEGYRMKKEVQTTGESPPNQNYSYGGEGENDCGKGVGALTRNLPECRWDGESEMDTEIPWEIRDNTEQVNGYKTKSKHKQGRVRVVIRTAWSLIKCLL